MIANAVSWRRSTATAFKVSTNTNWNIAISSNQMPNFRVKL